MINLMTIFVEKQTQCNVCWYPVFYRNAITLRFTLEPFRNMQEEQMHFKMHRPTLPSEFATLCSLCASNRVLWSIIDRITQARNSSSLSGVASRRVAEDLRAAASVASDENSCYGAHPMSSRKSIELYILLQFDMSCHYMWSRVPRLDWRYAQLSIWAMSRCTLTSVIVWKKVALEHIDSRV